MDAGEEGNWEEAPSAAEQEVTDVDLISTIESDLTLLIQIMSSSIHHISNKSAHVQLNAEIPMYNPTGAGQLMASKMLVDEESMADNIEELTDDLVGKVKDIEKLVEALPKEREEEEYQREIKELNDQVAGINEEYRRALQEASTLKVELDTTLHNLCENYQTTRERLALTAASQKKHQ
ncbi:hypothetical protein CBS101457_000570 [Exobasidium rhododendri]|nr:hypothetical protein CBS101457_000570 [Exobasidium rhododendri]